MVSVNPSFVEDNLCPRHRKGEIVRSENSLNNGSVYVLQEADFVKINVSGRSYETTKETLSRIPKTRLSELNHSDPHYRSDVNEYFFDRHAEVFESVLNFYRSGELHVPLNLCYTVVKRELDYWGINDGMMERCCFVHYYSYAEQRSTLEKFEERMAKLTYDVPEGGCQEFSAKVWDFLENPRSSIPALVSMIKY